MKTEYVFPEIDINVSLLKDITKIEIATWVRIKRNRKHYFVLVSDKNLIQNKKDFIPFLSVTKDLALLVNKFTQECMKAKYLYRVPNHSKGIDELVEKEIFRIDISHLSDKEEFLLNFRPF